MTEPDKAALESAPGHDSPARPAARRLRLSSRALVLSLLGVALLGALLRVVICAQLVTGYPPAFAPSPPTDMWFYQTLAGQVMDGTYDYSQGFAQQPFYYTVFLPAVYAVCGKSPWAVCILQSGLAAATIWLTGITFALAFGRWAGLAGAFLLALARYHAFHTAFSLLEVLQGFWLSLLLYLCLRAWQQPAPWRWTVVGLVLGLASITRGNAILLAPIVLAALILRLWRRGWKTTVLSAALLAVFAVLPQLPYAWVNARAFGFWIGPSSTGAHVLALGNSPEAPPGGRDPDTGSGGQEFTDTVREWIRLDHTKGPGRVPASTSLWNCIRQEPLAWLELKFRVFLLFWTFFEIPNNVALNDWDPRTGELEPVPSSLLHSPVLLDFGIPGTLGLAGLALAFRGFSRRPKAALLASLMGAGCLATVLFYMLARFRVPLTPWICGFGGVALVSLVRSWRRTPAGGAARVTTGRRRARERVVLALLLSALTVFFAYTAYRNHLEKHLIRWARPSGVRLELENRFIRRDNGPRTFGGWVPVPVPTGGSSLRIRKTFVPIGAETSGTLVLSLMSPSGGDLRVRANDRFGQVRLPRGIHQLPIALSVSGLPGPVVTVDLELRAEPPGKIFVMCDTQRDYGRTWFSDPSAAGGELVAEWVVARPGSSR